MPERQLPTPAEARMILARKRSRPPRRPPPPAGRQLGPVIKALDERFGHGVGALHARWREIVGDRLATRTEPVKLIKPRGGGPATLELRVAGPVATLVQHQAQDILARLGLILGKDAVGKLRIVQAPLSGRGAEAGAPPAPKRRPAPLDAAEEAALARELETLADGRLKRALTRLGRGVIGRVGPKS